jgi:hypothetical protein
MKAALELKICWITSAARIEAIELIRLASLTDLS